MPFFSWSPKLIHSIWAGLLGIWKLKTLDTQNVVYLYNRILLGYKKEVLIHATTWMNLENITLSERRQSQKSVRFHIVFHSHESPK